jgi:hypothetical protein
VIPLAVPGRTRALEFADGKVMLNEPRNVQAVTWERVLEGAGDEEGLIDHLRGVQLLGIVNWSLMGGVDGILQGLINRILPQLRQESRPRIFIDLTDPAKRTDADLRGVLSLLAELNRLTPVTLGLNVAEAERVGSVVGAAIQGNLALLNDVALRASAAMLLGALNLHCLVVHRHKGAVAAMLPSGSGAMLEASFAGPFVSQPRISTGAGDHFNGGFAVAQTLGMPLAECLAVGCGVAGYYVRHAKAPARRDLVDFLRRLPQPEPVEE